MRVFFAVQLNHLDICLSNILWPNYRESMTEDILHSRRTINKGQVQTVIVARIDLTTQCFSHEQLYVNTKKYHVFAPMGRFQLESIYLYFPPSSQLLYFVSVL